MLSLIILLLKELYDIKKVNNMDQFPKKGTLIKLPGLYCMKLDKYRKTQIFGNISNFIDTTCISGISDVDRVLFCYNDKISVNNILFPKKTNFTILSKEIFENYISEENCTENEKYELNVHYFCGNSITTKLHLTSFYFINKCKIDLTIKSKKLCKLTNLTNEKIIKIKCIEENIFILNNNY